jgi:hypothetical protein
MKKPAKLVLFWTPRILGIFFIFFVGMFSLDVFSMEKGFMDTLLAVFIHNAPALLLLAFLLIGWHREWVASAGFLLFGGWYLFFVRGADVTASLLLGGLPIFIALLFLLGWVMRKKIPD